MTVEEIEIIVTTKVQEAMKNLKKITPEIKKTVRQVEETFSKVDTTEFNKKVEQSTELVKREVRRLKSNSNNNQIDIKINNTNIKQKIDETKKAIDSLKKSTTAGFDMSQLKQYKNGVESTTAQEKLLIHQIQQKQELLKNAIPYNATDIEERYKESLKKGIEPQVFNEENYLKVNADIEKLQNKLYKLQNTKIKIQIETFDPNDVSGIKFNLGGQQLRGIRGASTGTYKAELGTLADAYDKVIAKKQQFESGTNKFQTYDTTAIQEYVNQYASLFNSKNQIVKEQIKSLNNEFQGLKTSGKIKLDLNSKEAQEKIYIFNDAIRKLNPALANITTQISKIIKDASSMGDAIEGAVSSAGSGISEFQLSADLIAMAVNLIIQKIEEIKQKIEEIKQKVRSIFDWIESKAKAVAKKLIEWINPFNKIQKSAQKTGNSMQKMANNLKMGVKDLLKYATALFSIRTIYTFLSSSANSWLSSQNKLAQQLNANIDYMKYALGSAFTPIMEYLVNLAYALMKTIQNIVYALFKVNIYANASASSYASMASSAKSTSKAMKQLAGIHNEINNISNSNSGDSSGTTSPNFDLATLDTSNSILDAIENGNWYQIGQAISTKIQDALDNINWTKIKKSAKKIATNISDFLNGFIEKEDIGTTIGNTLAEGINTALDFVESFIKNFHWDSLGKTIGDGVNGLFLKIDWNTLGADVGNGINGIINTIYNAITTIKWSDIAIKLADGLNNAVSTIDWSKAGQTLSKGLINWFNSISTWLQEVDWKKVGESIKTFILNIDWKGIWESLVDAFLSFKDSFQDVLAGIFGEEKAEDIMNTLEAISVAIVALKIGDLINTIKEWAGPITIFVSIIGTIKEVIEALTRLKEKFSGISSWIGNAYSNLTTPFKNVGTWFKTTFSIVWANIKSAFNTSTIKSYFTSVFTSIKNAFSSIPTWFKTTFATAWTNVKNVFSTGGKIFSGIKDGILNGLKSIINGIIDGINKVIKVPFDGINNALKKIKSINILGNKPFSSLSTISIPSIPKLAKGGALTEATLLIAGEYSGAKSNPEIVAPQNIMHDTILKALSEAEFGDDNRPIYLTVNVGNEKIGQILLDNLRDKRRRTGKGIEALIGG